MQFPVHLGDCTHPTDDLQACALAAAVCACGIALTLICVWHTLTPIAATLLIIKVQCCACLPHQRAPLIIL